MFNVSTGTRGWMCEKVNENKKYQAGESTGKPPYPDGFVVNSPRAYQAKEALV